MDSSVDSKCKFFRGRCRCCLSEGYLRSLLREYEDGGATRMFSEVLVACFRFELVPSKSEIGEYLICESCVLRLLDVEKFRRQIEEACRYFEGLAKDPPHNGWVFFDTSHLQLRQFSPAHDDCKSEEDDGADDRDDARSFDDAAADPDFNWDSVLQRLNADGKNRKASKRRKKKKGGAAKRKAKPSNDVITAVPTLKIGRLPYQRLPYKLDEASLNCVECGQHFFSKLLLSIHMNAHYPNHICDTCGKGFAVRTRLQAHLKSHLKTEFPCGKCEKVFNSYNSRESHRRHHHGKMVYKCPVCRTRFGNYHARLKHMSAEHGTESRRHHCTICPGTFMRASHLSTHVKMVHLKEKRVSCETCGAAFFTKSMLDNHMAGHIAKRDHICHVCNRSYLRRKTLLYHMKVHSKDCKPAADKPHANSTPENAT